MANAEHEMAGRGGLASVAPRAHPTSSSSMARCTCQRPSATPKPSFWKPTSPAHFFRHRRHRRRNLVAAPHVAFPTKFASRMKRMGVGDGMHVVAYDSEGPLFGGARVVDVSRPWATRKVRVLNGGLKKWKDEGRPLEDGPPRQRTPAPLFPGLQCLLGARCRRSQTASSTAP